MSVVGTGAIETAGIPHPRWRVPVLGDVVGVRPSTIVQDSIRIGRELGPIFRRKLLGFEMVFASGAEMVAELVDESRFGPARGPGVDYLRNIAGDGLFTAHNDEPNWRLAHDILMPAFTQKAMRAYHSTMLDVAGELIESWDRRVGRAAVDVAADMTRVTLETIGRAGFGYEFGSFRRERPHPFVAAMARCLRHAQRVNVRVPGLGRPGDRRYRADAAFMAGVVDEVIRARREAGDRRTDDLLGLMLNTAHPDSGEPLDEVNIRNQVITFLVAGHETTSGALAFALYYLSRDPAALSRAQAEVDLAWGERERPEFEQVAKLRHVRRALDEALRLWPTVPGFARQAREDTVLAGRYPVRKGQPLIVVLPLLHRDPVWGVDADVFDPDRFAPDRVRNRPAHVYKPFGTGLRACIGRQFALHEAVLVLGLLLRRYRPRVTPGYQLRVRELLTLKPDGFALELEHRKIGAH
ncbi:cytochrome P450 [Pseudonocardia acaciae]|uniref:cytochrome P450 n=1 Tax=Pseudonocardia acaciae TaxID=551276 RepID=UPI00049084E5|nr:cytochrome P450 [Pseudonocardia acaciae]